MKTLHFIYLNNCFVSIHVVVRFTHAYRDFVANNDYGIFSQIPGPFKRQRPKNAILTMHVLRNKRLLTAIKPTRKHLQMSTGNKKTIYCYKTLPFSDGIKETKFLACARRGLR